jgi:enoyl-CoA hydratase/carnithine racemase
LRTSSSRRRTQCSRTSRTSPSASCRATASIRYGREVIGSIRGRTFVLTQQIIGAEEAKTLGVVSEIVTRDRLLRAREIAGRIAKLLH